MGLVDGEPLDGSFWTVPNYKNYNLNLPKWFLPVQNELDVSKTNYFGTKEGQGMRLEVNVSIQ